MFEHVHTSLANAADDIDATQVHTLDNARARENEKPMEHGDLIERLGLGGDDASREFLALLLRSAAFREILDDYAIVAEASAHWSHTKGEHSHEARQYRQLTADSLKEITSFMTDARSQRKA